MDVFEKGFEAVSDYFGLGLKWDEAWNGIVTLIKLFVLGWIVLIGSAVAAVLLYWLFYWLYVPDALISAPVYFDFPRSSIAVNPDSPSPAAMLRIGTNSSSSLVLARNQGYDINLILKLPDNSVNTDLGMFMVTVAMSPERNTTCHLLPSVFCRQNYNSTYVYEHVAYDVHDAEKQGQVVASKPASLWYRSNMKYYMQVAIFAVPLAFGWVDEHQTVTVELLRDFHDPVIMGSNQIWIAATLSEPSLQVASAELEIRAHFRGLAYLMHEWFFITFAFTSWVTTAAIFTLSAAFLYLIKDWLVSEDTLVETPIQMKDIDESTLLKEALDKDSSLRFNRNTGLYSFDVQDQSGGESAKLSAATPGEEYGMESDISDSSLRRRTRRIDHDESQGRQERQTDFLSETARLEQQFQVTAKKLRRVMWWRDFRSWTITALVLVVFSSAIYWLVL